MSIVFYDDSPIFGGHEVMCLAGVDALLKSYSKPVFFYATEVNSTLCERLDELDAKYHHLRVRHLPWHSSKLESLRNLLRPSRTGELVEMLDRDQAKLVVAVQGNIEHSSLSLKACKISNITSMSYIPVPHSNRTMGAKLGFVRDVFSTPIFKWPDSFLTISEEMERLLRIRGACAPVKVVYNGIDIDRFKAGDTEKARVELGLPVKKLLLGVIGRIEFRQKQQDLLVEAVSSSSTLSQKCHLVFAGEGPDSGRLKRMLIDKNIPHSIFEWCDTAPLYKALDALVIPSRYEGLPLVMLEALSSEVMVFGSDRDGMRDVLQAENRFTPADPSALMRALNGWVNRGCPGPEVSLVRRIREEMSLDHFRVSFTDHIISKC